MDSSSNTNQSSKGKPCKEGQILNPVTGRCASAKRVLKVVASTGGEAPAPAPTEPVLQTPKRKRKLVAVPSEEQLAPTTTTTTLMETIVKPCKKEGQILNPVTGRCASPKRVEKSVLTAASAVDVSSGVKKKVPRRLVDITPQNPSGLAVGDATEIPNIPRALSLPPPSLPLTVSKQPQQPQQPFSLFVAKQQDQRIPSLEDFVPIYPPQTHPDIQRIIASKKEFLTFKAKTGEPMPQRGELFAHQKLFERLMRAYDKILLIAEPGTGKTLSFLAVTEYLKSVGVYKRAYILEKGPILLNSVKLQLACKATRKGVYDTAAVDQARSDRARAALLTRSMSDFYSFMTYTTFASEFSDLSDDEVIEKYSGCVFVIDEAHNLVSDAKSSSRYAAFLRVLTLAKRTKIILATATPMVNSTNELGPLMNFILPSERAFPTNYKFSPFSSVNPQDILERCRGFVSYVRAEGLKAASEYVGVPLAIEGLPETAYPLINPIEMGDLQKKAYEKVEPSEGDEESSTTAAPAGAAAAAASQQQQQKEKGENAFYIKSLQASSFVFPDGSFGGQVEGGSSREIEISGLSEESGIAKYVVSVPRKPGFYAFKNDPEFKRWKYAGGAKNFKDWLSGVGRPDGTEPWFNLSRLSCKFAKIVEIETQNIATEGTSFVYSEAKNGGGAILLGLCLELFGFERFTPTFLAPAPSSSGSAQVEDDDFEEVEVEEDVGGIPEDEGIQKEEGRTGRGLCGSGRGGSASKASLPPIGKGLRYALLTPELPQAQQKQILSIFNSPYNVNGEYIKVIIGSRIARDGIDLFHCVRVHLLIPPWTSSGTIQAVARALRAVSHDVLYEQRRKRIVAADASAAGANRTEEEIDQAARVTVRLYRHTAVYEGHASADKIVYKISSEKDFEVRRIMRVLKEASIDCYLNYDRNVSIPYKQRAIRDNTQECDYDDCKYTCGGGRESRTTGSSGQLQQLPIDYSTYDTLYIAPEVKEAETKLLYLLGERIDDTIEINDELLRMCEPLRPAAVFRAIENLLKGTKRFVTQHLFQNSYATLLNAQNNNTQKLVLQKDLTLKTRSEENADVKGIFSSDEIDYYITNKVLTRSKPFRESVFNASSETSQVVPASTIGVSNKIEQDLLNGRQIDPSFEKFLYRTSLRAMIKSIVVGDDPYEQRYKSFLERINSQQTKISDVVFIHTILVDEEREIIGEYTSKNTRFDLTRICIPADSYEWRYILPGPEFKVVTSFISGKISLTVLTEASPREEDTPGSAAAAAAATTERETLIKTIKQLLKTRTKPLTTKESLYGKIDTSTNLLRIIDQRLRTTKPSGRECGTYSRGDLIVFIILLDPEADAYFVSKFSGVESGEALAERLKEEDEKGIKENEKSVNSYTDSLKDKFGDVYFAQLDSIPKNVRERIFKLGRLPREFLCGFIRNVFEATDRLVMGK